MTATVSDSPIPTTVQSVQTVVAGTAIVVNPTNAVVTVVQVQTDGAVTMTATPMLTAGKDGQEIRLINVDTNVLHTIILTDLGTLAGSGASLNASTVTLSSKKGLALVYNAALGAWIQL